jgi:nucleoside-diphosphate-sugar epimerase
MTPPLRVALIVATTTALQPERVFIGGLGYCGLRIAEQFHDTYGCNVAGCVRSAEKQAALTKNYPWLEAHVLDLDNTYQGLDADGREALASATHIVETVAPIADFDEDPLLALHADCFDRQWVAYLSSTGVYGDHAGSWIDENAGLLCTDAKSLARVKAEEAYANHDAVVLRLGGIYGPGRSLLDAQRRTASTSEKPVNRIHVDDIAGLLIALADRDIQSTTYNVVDDDPAPRSAVSAFVDELIGPAPATGAAKPSRGTGSKRCRNEKLREVYELLAPTYKEGLLRIKDADPAIAAAARRQERIAAAQRDLQAVALADQRADVESGETYWMRDKYQELQRLAAAEEGSSSET